MSHRTQPAARGVNICIGGSRHPPYNNVGPGLGERLRVGRRHMAASATVGQCLICVLAFGFYFSFSIGIATQRLTDWGMKDPSVSRPCDLAR